MNFNSLLHIKKAISSLNPNQVREMCEHPLQVALYAANAEEYRQMEQFFLRDLSPRRRQTSAFALFSASGMTERRPYDLAVAGPQVAAPRDAMIFDLDHPARFVEKVLSKQQNLGLPLAKTFLPFRKPFVDKVIAKTARENTLFSLTTALPDIIPSVIELPWAVAEFASDTAFLTMNQVRMAFLIAGACDREVGYREQKTEIAAVIGSAFGWRALARQLVGKIPFGGGLIAKAGIAYAGTKVLGLSLDRYYSLGYTYSRDERDSLYADAFNQGKRVAGRLLGSLRPDLAAKYLPDLKSR